MTLLSDLRARLDPDALIALACDLIRFDSEAPPGREEGVARFAADFMRRLGFVADVDAVAPGRANAVGRLPGAVPGGPVLAFNGHLDVVPRGDVPWTTPPFAPEVRDGRIYGRGAADMKGGIAAALYAVSLLRDAGITLNGDLLFALDADEEVSNLGLRKMLADGLFAPVSACIIGEPTGLEIAVGHRGVAAVRAAFTGVSVHAAQAWRGVNAIYHARRFLDRVAVLGLRKVKEKRHSLLGPALITPTRIEGGFRVNVVPDRCVVTFDVRLVPGETLDTVMAELEAAAADLRAELPDLDVAFSHTTYCPPGVIDADEPVVKALEAAAVGVCPTRVKAFEATGELSLILEGAGTPSVFFGPGFIAQAHTVDEWVDVDQLTRAALVYARTFCGFLGVAGDRGG